MAGSDSISVVGLLFFYGEFMGNYGYFGAFFGEFPLFEVVIYGYFSLFCGIFLRICLQICKIGVHLQCLLIQIVTCSLRGSIG